MTVRAVPLARRNLFEDRRRAVLAVAGLAASLVLVLVLDGIFAGAMRQVTAYLRNLPADVIVSQKGVRTMHMSASALPEGLTQEIRSVLMVSHDTRLQEVADRVLWLEDGTLADMAQMTVDPVCGMSVAIAQGPHYQHGGRTWWFCSSPCRDEFAIEPARYERRQINKGYVGTTERSD
jgi:YHS domain-containing protein